MIKYADKRNQPNHVNRQLPTPSGERKKAPKKKNLSGRTRWKPGFQRSLCVSKSRIASTEDWRFGSWIHRKSLSPSKRHEAWQTSKQHTQKRKEKCVPSNAASLGRPRSWSGSDRDCGQMARTESAPDTHLQNSYNTEYFSIILALRSSMP